VAYIYGLIIVALLSLAMHYYTELSMRQKILIALILLAAIASAIFYNHTMQQQQEKLLNIQTRYEQGKTIHCQGVDVNQSTHSLSIGTFTFIGKENTPYYAQMISASTCQ